MVKEQAAESVDNPDSSSILQNPAVIFDEIDKVKDRFNENDYEDIHGHFVKWIIEQWKVIREATQNLEIGEEVNELVRYTGRSVTLPVFETITILCKQEMGGISIEFESFADERLERVVITDWKWYTTMEKVPLAGGGISRG